MPDFRVHCLPKETNPTTLRLTPEESHHLVTVNRAYRGAPVIAFDGRGTEWICTLAAEGRTGAVLHVRETRRAPPLPCAMTLAQALPKGAGMDDIVRQATELGTTRIVPLYSERTQVHLEGGREEKKLEKWRLTALEAAKQCGNPWLPEIAPALTLPGFLATHAAQPSATPSPPAPPASGSTTANATSAPASTYDLKLIASLHAGAQPLGKIFDETRAALGRSPRRVLWLIGPEGDFTPAELEAAGRAGFRPATLGQLVLRCDTAALCALSVTAHELSAG
jgi:16S rRNA (uracil1498-N3)-methyltransferase